MAIRFLDGRSSCFNASWQTRSARVESSPAGGRPAPDDAGRCWPRGRPGSAPAARTASAGSGWLAPRPAAGTGPCGFRASRPFLPEDSRKVISGWQSEEKRWQARRMSQSRSRAKEKLSSAKVCWPKLSPVYWASISPHSQMGGVPLKGHRMGGVPLAARAQRRWRCQSSRRGREPAAAPSQRSRLWRAHSRGPAPPDSRSLTRRGRCSGRSLTGQGQTQKRSSPQPNRVSQPRRGEPGRSCSR